MDSKELVMHTFVKNKHKTMIGGQKKIVFGGPRVRKARKAFRKERTNFLKVIFVPSIEKKVQIKITNRLLAEPSRVKIGAEMPRAQEPLFSTSSGTFSCVTGQCTGTANAQPKFVIFEIVEICNFCNFVIL